MAFFNTYRSGELVPASGSYAALHSTPHKLVERSVHIEGDRFEQCGMCPLGVLYRLEQSGVQRPLFVNPQLDAMALC
ncbi:MAG: hypothetical protein WA474_00140 [Candidatus Sulfotelmatobacter sp.]